MFVKFDRIVPDTGDNEAAATKALKVDFSDNFDTFGAAKFSLLGTEPYYLTFTQNQGLGEDEISQTPGSYLSTLKNDNDAPKTENKPKPVAAKKNDTPTSKTKSEPVEETVNSSDKTKKNSKGEPVKEQTKTQTKAKPKEETTSKNGKKGGGLTAKDLFSDLFE